MIATSPHPPACARVHPLRIGGRKPGVVSAPVLRLGRSRWRRRISLNSFPPRPSPPGARARRGGAFSIAIALPRT